MSKLYIVATPIGNLSDITLRAIEKLKECNFIICEDTRVTGKLLNHLEIKKQMISMNAFSEKKDLSNLLSKIIEADSVCLVSDAGTPAISDPGTRIVNLARENKIDIEPIPGPSALISALSASGFDTSKFIFLGFLPKKKGRKTLFEKIKETEETIIFYESPHRILKTLKDLLPYVTPELPLVTPVSPPVTPAQAGAQVLNKNKEGLGSCLRRNDKIAEGNKNNPRKIGVYKEISKIHEEFISGNSEEVLSYFEENSDKVKGEFVVIIDSVK